MRDKAGSTAAPAARCRTCLRWGSFIAVPRSRLASLDHLVGYRQQLIWNLQAKRLGGLDVDNQFKLARLDYREVCGVRAIKNPAGVLADLTKGIVEACSIAHQPTGFGIITKRIGRRGPVLRRQKSQLGTTAAEERIGGDKNGVRLFALERCKGR